MGQSIRKYADINENLRFWLRRALGRFENPVFYDIGANDGVFTLAFGKTCGRVYAFEPSEVAFERLRSRVAEARLMNVTPYRVALADTEGSVDLHRFTDDTFNSLYRRTDGELSHYSLGPRSTETVDVVRLDGLVVRDHLASPDVVKMDVEGAELFVLRGGETTIRRAMPILVAEYSVDNTANAGYERVEIANLLESWGYDVAGLFRNIDITLYRGGERERRSVWNLLAIPPAHRPILDG